MSELRRCTSCLVVLLLCSFGSGTTKPEFESMAPETFDQRLKEAKEVLQNVPLIDGQNDLAMSLHDLVSNRLNLFPFNKNLSQLRPWAMDSYSHTDLPRLRAGMVAGELWSAWVPCGLSGADIVVNGLSQVDVIKRLIAKYPDDLEIAPSTQDIWDAFEEGKIASLITLDGGHMIHDSLAVLRTYYHTGVRSMTLTHLCNTEWAESCCTAKDQHKPTRGLTDFGQVVIGEMNRIGMIIDLTHSSLETMKDVFDITAAPVIFSHTAAFTLCNNSANIPDEIIRQLRDNDGIIMVNFNALLLTCSKQATIHDVIDHLNYIRNITGPDHLGIGSNFNGFVNTASGLENASKFPQIFAELLLDPTWTKEDLEKLAGRNFLRVFEQVEAAHSEYLRTRSYTTNSLSVLNIPEVNFLRLAHQTRNSPFFKFKASKRSIDYRSKLLFNTKNPSTLYSEGNNQSFKRS